ncbi:MAG: metallophosphoesterase family protein [Peptostreptococcaceae bacterium]
MKFIHTSDWHLGKSLEGYSRLEEQKKFCADFVERVNDLDVNLIIIAGDVYDVTQTSPEVEKLFYSTISKISNNGQRCVLVVRGESDNPYKLGAIAPMAYRQGVIIVENLMTKIEPIKYSGFEILESKEGCVKLSINGEKAVIITLPYTSENEIDDLLFKHNSNYISKNTYSQKISNAFDILEENFTDDSINIAVGHLPLAGGESRSSERNIDFGKKVMVEKRDLPNKAQYIALGHLHKMQMASQRLNAYYSGSPLQYSKEEKEDTKGGYLVEIEANKKPIVEELYFDNYKPIEVFTCNEVKTAMELCEENKDRDIWSYFEIKVDEPISSNYIKRMKETLKDIVEIKPISNCKSEYITNNQKSITELFKEFYLFNNGKEIKGELMDLFLEITNEEGGIK